MINSIIAAKVKELSETNKFGYPYIRYDRKPDAETVEAYKKEYGIKTDCHSLCHVCQITHIEKYKPTLEFENNKSLTENGKPLDKWFNVECNFIAKGLEGSAIREKLNELTAKGISEKRAKRIILQSIDPVNWLELLMGFDDDSKSLPEIERHWYLRWYQKPIIRCTAKRQVLRMGRRTGKSSSAALKIINWAFNHKVFNARDADGVEQWKGPKIAIITPFQSQVSAIFVEIERLLRLNKSLEEEVVQTGAKLFKQSPPLTMTFKNGCVIEGYVTGSNDKEDGSGGGSIRGAFADIIYIDEMDMVPEYIIASVIKPLLRSRASTIMLCSSTPIGKKGSFYKACLEDDTYKEFYFPGDVLPFWDLQEKEILSEGTKDSFTAEYMAVFNIDSFGAFKASYIVAARSNYSYEDTEDSKWWLQPPFKTNFYKFSICMGIDWNQTTGTEFSVVAFDPKSGMMYVLENYCMEASEYSGEGYKDALKRLNHKWNPKYIYCDYGYGHMLFEGLQLESMYAAAKPVKTDYERSVAGLKDKLKEINFSSNLEIYNPSTGTYETKYAKNFLVENAISIFERKKILFAEDDKTLIKQLQNYIVVEKKDNGKVIYGMVNESIGDHRLDALCLALGGLQIEESVFSYSAPDYSFHHSPLSKDMPESNDPSNGLIVVDNQLVGFKNHREINFKPVTTEEGIGLNLTSMVFKQKTNKIPPNRRSMAESDLHPNEGIFEAHGLAKFVKTGKGADEDDGHFHKKFSGGKISPRGNSKVKKVRTPL